MSNVIRAGVACLLALAASIVSGGTPGDPGPGKALFEGKGGCVKCHAIDNRGGSLGPDLSEIGVMRSPETLRLALIDPDAEIEEEYFTITVVTNRGEQARGIRLNEDDFSIQLRDADGDLRSFQKDNLKSMRRELHSLMPSYGSKLSTPEIDNLVAYLSSLKGNVVAPGEIVPRARAIARVSERLEWLTRPDRDADERPNAVLDALQIPEGAATADVGAGAGYYTWRLAQRVGPKGKVIAVEIQQKMLDLIAEDLAKRNITNVDLVLGDESDPRLPGAALDLVLLGNAYHEFSEPEAMMAAIRRSLKPNGRLVVLEYRKEDAYTPVEPLHKMTLREARSEIEGMGFQIERILQFVPMQHILIFSRRAP